MGKVLHWEGIYGVYDDSGVLVDSGVQQDGLEVLAALSGLGVEVEANADLTAGLSYETDNLVEHLDDIAPYRLALDSFDERVTAMDARIAELKVERAVFVQDATDSRLAASGARRDQRRADRAAVLAAAEAAARAAEDDGVPEPPPT